MLQAPHVRHAACARVRACPEAGFTNEGSYTTMYYGKLCSWGIAHAVMPHRRTGWPKLDILNKVPLDNLGSDVNIGMG